jgi:SAM-dependent methyltransferase
MDDAMRRRAESFGAVADLYDRHRPSYPDAAVDDILAAVPSAADVVEIGSGTGKATALFARRGLRVTAIEPSREMAATARRNLAAHSNVEIVVTPFERWDGPSASADVIAAAQSWHWLDTASATAACRRVLRRPGVLALLANTPRPAATELRSELDAVYEVYAPQLVGSSVMTSWTGGGGDERFGGALVAGGFEPPRLTSYDWTQRYSTAEYTGLLQTHSDHGTLEPDALRGLLDGVAAVVDANGGSMVFAYRTILLLTTPTD